ncbi:ribonuclease P/MRP protein subunit POP5 isoform X1 [Canis lupus dingo]|uniref:ribonuclease P/MRP protein subunit POP5 isoform X1 n=1 Tax=Canis lupus dingo TaxID=286419 RepID=UPI0020C40421|nr:ribonuclease P/MRP protein subunit POP5 isoform X1 [Canis lupus dingo]
MSGRFDRPPLEAWKSWETGLRGHLGGQGAPGMYLAEPGGRGSQPPSHEDFQAALWRGLDGEELRVSANSQHQRASHGSEPAGSFIPSPAFRWLANSLTATSGGTMSQNHPAELLLILDPQQLCESKCQLSNEKKGRHWKEVSQAPPPSLIYLIWDLPCREVPGVTTASTPANPGRTRIGSCDTSMPILE